MVGGEVGGGAVGELGFWGAVAFRALRFWRLAIGGWLLAAGDFINEYNSTLTNLQVNEKFQKTRSMAAKHSISISRVRHCALFHSLSAVRSPSFSNKKAESGQRIADNVKMTYTKLKVWELSHQLTLKVYKASETFPKSELYGLVSQIRRAAYSVPSNIIEGKSRESDKEFKRFLVIARASVDELSYFLLLSKDLKYLTSDQYSELSDNASHIGAMLNNLITKINMSLLTPSVGTETLGADTGQRKAESTL